MPSMISPTRFRRVLYRHVAASLVAVIMVASGRTAAHAAGFGAGAGAEGAARGGVGVIAGVTAAVALAGFGVWYFFIRDKKDEKPPEALAMKMKPVDVSNGPRTGLACASSDGNVPATCW